MYLITFAIVAAFTAFLLYSFIYIAAPKKKIYDFIIIHGAGLRDGEYVTPLLKQRIDKAIDAYINSRNPDIKIIASGGQGPDEKLSDFIREIIAACVKIKWVFVALYAILFIFLFLL
ncbi:YdcF family protein [Mogibacterium sp.]